MKKINDILNDGRAAIITAITVLGMPTQAAAYPVDCAILLCLAGGFPSSPECTAAKVEMIRRITPFPIEPPLQLWNCPMDGAGVSPIGSGPDGLPPEVRAYRDGIEIYHIDYRQSRGGGDVHVLDRSKVGHYEDRGEFFWTRTEMRDAPDWIFAATGVNRHSVQNQIGTILRWRGVLIRWTDHTGAKSTEWVRY
ncbi:hypothetical protein [Paracoccus laeviglucosivorans]|uniref:Uncharacterized protein n=1 Tax=Paracoccus laeviglucosivorans TaxID=1197861 RepID=A0A521FW05_9RHOB|nr:hypothetical protein [Paracoccus laeviglucosivorans]SMO99960.1 hypothetical protein SAMN06265221_1535 [Paracoccus laeviglucosivorans]